MKRTHRLVEDDEQGNNRTENVDDNGPPRKILRVDYEKVPRILDGTFYTIESLERASGSLTAKCTQCNKCRKGNISSTGNFLSHYRSTHKDMLAELERHSKAIILQLIEPKISVVAPPTSKEEV